jgi:hypothetical protein
MSHAFGPTAKEYIVDALRSGEALEFSYSRNLSCDLNILWMPKEKVKIKTYSIQQLKELRV